jgi:hypothetical protein
MDICSNFVIKGSSLLFDDKNIGCSRRYGYERRGEKRRLQRLNWGKTLTLGDEFLSECLIVNLTGKGACLRIARPVYVPRFFLLFIDYSGALFEGEAIWRHGAQLGCKLVESSHANGAIIARHMCGKYYAL